MSGSLNHSPAEVIRQLLVDLSVGVLPDDHVDGVNDWPIYAANEPDTPDNCITVYDTTSVVQGRTQTDGIYQEHYGLEIRLRATSHVVGHDKANELVVVIDQTVHNNTVIIDDHVGAGTTEYLVYCMNRRSGPFNLGSESPSSKRVLFTINAVAPLRQTS